MGALLITLDIRHPDTIDFIFSKASPEKVFEKDIFNGQYPTIDAANISLKLTDDFMDAVANDEDWDFIFPDIEAVGRGVYNKEWDGNFDNWRHSFKTYSTVRARDVLYLIAESSKSCGDPGIVFIDTIQKNTFSTYIDKSLTPCGLNPCAEQPLAPFQNCLLGALVLWKYVVNPYADKAFFDDALFEDDVKLAVRIMNKFSDVAVTKHPLQKQQETDAYSKRIGIEVTGVADMLTMLHLNDTKYFIDRLFSKKQVIEIRESIQIAKEQGCCEALKPVENRQNLINSDYFKQLRLTEADKKDLLEYGMANTALSTVGPTGSLSILAGNCTSGIEPLFAFSYSRKNRIDNKEYTFIHYLAAKYMFDNIKEFEGLSIKAAQEKLGYVEAHSVNWEDRIKLQSIIGQYVDSSISSTVNLHSSTSVDDIIKIYTSAWDNNLKGITIFVDGCKDGVLTATKKSEPEDNGLYERELLDIEQAERHRVTWKKSKMYVNVSLDDDKPIEIFAKLPVEAGVNGDGVFNPTLWQERTSQWDLVCRLISMILRYNIPLEQILEQLDKSSYSMVDAAGILGRVLRRYQTQMDVDVQDDTSTWGLCPECGENTLVNEGGCQHCLSCAYSKCG